MASEIQGYLVKGTWRGEGGPCDVYAYWWTLINSAGEVQWCADRAKAAERGRLLFPTVNEADAARCKSSHLSDVAIYRVYADGREERLPDLEDALAEIERLRAQLGAARQLAAMAQKNVDVRDLGEAMPHEWFVLCGVLEDGIGSEARRLLETTESRAT